MKTHLLEYGFSGLRHNLCDSYFFITLKMSLGSMPLPLPLPEALRPWLVLNVEFYAIICSSASCRQALSPSATSCHLRDKHQVKIEHRKQLDEYLKQWQWQYDFRSVPLPLDGSLPQPVLPIIDGFQCRDCAYKTTNRDVMRQHSNREHKKKRVKDEEICRAVQLQTWFREKRARYWVVVATGLSRDVNHNRSGSGSDDAGAAIKAEIAEWTKTEE